MARTRSASQSQANNAPMVDKSSPAMTIPAVECVDDAIILVKEDHFDVWSEKVELYALSQFGAAFNASRECGIGRLIEINLPPSIELEPQGSCNMPNHIVCLVQQCSQFIREGKPAFHIGVVFVGRTLPDSFNSDPKQCFRVTGTRDNGLFRIQETNAPHKTRRHPRFRIKLDVNLLHINKAERSVVPAIGVTNDVGTMGISVISTLNAQVGDKIKVACGQVDFFGVAVVCNRRVRFGFEYFLQMEFVESKFPIGRVLSVPDGVFEGFMN